MAERFDGRQRKTITDAKTERLQDVPTHRVAFVGMGAGNLGVVARLAGLDAQDGTDRLHTLLKQGAGFYDNQPFGSQTLNFLNDPNSASEDFLDLIHPEGKFGSVLAGSAAQEMQAGVEIDLRHAHRFYRDIGERFAEILGDYPESGAIQKHVSYVVYNPRAKEDDPKRFTLYGSPVRLDDEIDAPLQYPVIGYANKVVFATGGSQELRVRRDGKRDYTAEEILDGDGQHIAELYDTFLRLPAKERKLTGLGLSHGQLSAVLALLRHDEEHARVHQHKPILGEGAIQILARCEPELYSSTREEAEAIYKSLGREVREDLFVRKDNGDEVYARFVGVRSGTNGRYGAKDLYLDIKDGKEKRVTINLRPDADNLWEDELSAEASVVIQAFGLHTNLVPLFTPDRKVITVVDEKGSVTVGEQGNISVDLGGKIRDDIGAFAIGSGYPHSVRSDAIAQFAAIGEDPRRILAANLFGKAAGDELIRGLKL